MGIGKVYQNLMVDVVQTNMKLITRAEKYCHDSHGCTREEARDCLEEAEGSVKLAITMILLHCGAKSAKNKIKSSWGYVRMQYRTYKEPCCRSWCGCGKRKRCVSGIKPMIHRKNGRQSFG